MAKAKKKVAKKSAKKSVKRVAKKAPAASCMNMKYNACDIASLKIAVAAFVLFVLTIWPTALNLVMKVHWGWFLAIWVIFGAKPFMKWAKQ